jgi:hypothetical protein
VELTGTLVGVRGHTASHPHCDVSFDVRAAVSELRDRAAATRAMPSLDAYEALVTDLLSALDQHDEVADERDHYQVAYDSLRAAAEALVDYHDQSVFSASRVRFGEQGEELISRLRCVLAVGEPPRSFDARGLPPRAWMAATGRRLASDIE